MSTDSDVASTRKALVAVGAGIHGPLAAALVRQLRDAGFTEADIIAIARGDFLMAGKHVIRMGKDWYGEAIDPSLRHVRHIIGERVTRERAHVFDTYEAARVVLDRLFFCDLEIHDESEIVLALSIECL